MEDFDHFYAALEDRFRGSTELIKERLAPYRALVPQIEPRKVLDLGCGRGEWLQLLKEAEIPAEGIDLNTDFADRAANQGLHVTVGDVFEVMAGKRSGAFAAVTAFHLIEHLDWRDLLRLMREAHRLLAPGGVLIAEWPNAHNVRVATSSFWLDPTHNRLLPVPLVTFMAEYCGFEGIESKSYQRFPVPPAVQRPAPPVKRRFGIFSQPPEASPPLSPQEERLRLENILFGQMAMGQDVSIVGRKPRPDPGETA